MSIVKVLSCILLICFASLPLSAQVSSGELVGTITDTFRSGSAKCKDHCHERADEYGSS